MFRQTGLFYGNGRQEEEYREPPTHYVGAPQPRAIEGDEPAQGLLRGLGMTGLSVRADRLFMHGKPLANT